MRARLLVVVCAAFLSATSIAQEGGACFQVFGGYSYTGYAIYDTYSGPWRSFGYSGWEASGAAKLLPHVAAEADLAGGFASPNGRSSSLRTYMGGPRVSADFAKATVFGHVLFGGLSLNVTGFSPRTTSFATAIGGGADFWFSRHLGARVIQADYLVNTNRAAAEGLGVTGSHSHYRISAGVVLRFGH